MLKLHISTFIIPQSKRICVPLSEELNKMIPTVHEFARIHTAILFYKTEKNPNVHILILSLFYLGDACQCGGFYGKNACTWGHGECN